MQEYWVNVYPSFKGTMLGDKYLNRELAAKCDGGASIYRIHVKLKPKPIKKPVPWDLSYSEKFDWMGR